MNLIAVKEDLINICKKAGNYMLHENARFTAGNIEYKGKNNLVSYVDKETEKLLVKELTKLVPGAGFITEEETIKTEKKPLNWVIDPIDGTTNFLHRLPIFSISIALIDKDDQVMLGVIYDPSRNECFHTSMEEPSKRNDEIIHVSSTVDLGETLLATGFPYAEFEQMEPYLNIIHHFMRSTHGLRRMGSAAIDLAYVAAGIFDGFFEYNLKPWDVAAGVLLVKNAGGMVTDFSNGDDYIFGHQIIAAGKAHAEIQSVISDKWHK